MDKKLIQGTPEWLEMRRQYLGASDAPAVMGVSPWCTPFQLWEKKLGMAGESKMTPAMQRGIDMEPKARAAFEVQVGEDVFPQVLFHPEHKIIMASLDGLSLDGKVAVEIKCPGKKSHNEALSGKVPDVYVPQLQHQLAVSGLDMIYYYSFNGDTGIVLEVKRDDSYIEEMIATELKFWEYVTEKKPPPMVDADFPVIRDPQLVTIAKEWREVKEIYEPLKLREEELRKAIAEKAQGSGRCGGIRITRYMRRGSINYKDIPELSGVNFDDYRGEDIVSWRLKEES